YEFITGGGMWQDGSGMPGGSLLAEGQAMLQAIVHDFAALPDVEVVTTRDSRLPRIDHRDCRTELIDSANAELDAVQRLAAESDWTLLIAPETADVLLNRTRLVEAAGGRLLSPPSACVAIAGDKHATAELLARTGVPTPRGIVLDSNAPPLSASFP